MINARWIRNSWLNGTSSRSNCRTSPPSISRNLSFLTVSKMIHLFFTLPLRRSVRYSLRARSLLLDDRGKISRIGFLGFTLFLPFPVGHAGSPFAILHLASNIASFQRDATKPQEKTTLAVCDQGKLGGPVSPTADPNPLACRCNNGRLMRTRSRIVPLLPDSDFFFASRDTTAWPATRERCTRVCQKSCVEGTLPNRRTNIPLPLRNLASLLF